MGFFDSSSSSTNNNTQNYDQRQVNTATSESYDFSDRSTNTSSQSYDLSDNSQRNYTDASSQSYADSSTTITNTNTNLLDGGAISSMRDLGGAAVEGMRLLSSQVVDSSADQLQSGYDYADHIFDAATTFANGALGMSNDAFYQAAKMSRDTLTSAQSLYQGAAQSAGAANLAAMNAQQKAADQVAAAYADAKGTTASQKQIVMAVLGVAALFVLAMMNRKG